MGAYMYHGTLQYVYSVAHNNVNASVLLHVHVPLVVRLWWGIFSSALQTSLQLLLEAASCALIGRQTGCGRHTHLIGLLTRIVYGGGAWTNGLKCIVKNRNNGLHKRNTQNQSNGLNIMTQSLVQLWCHNELDKECVGSAKSMELTFGANCPCGVQLGEYPWGNELI